MHSDGIYCAALALQCMPPLMLSLEEIKKQGKPAVIYRRFLLDQSEGLGDKFLDEYEQAVSDIQHFPEACHPLNKLTDVTTSAFSKRHHLQNLIRQDTHPCCYALS